MQEPEKRRALLVVDDEPRVRDVLCRVLVLHDYAVFEGEDYYTALQVADSYDLLIADVALPGLNGFELFEKLLQSRPELKVLFISGYTGAEVCQYYGVQLDDLHFLAKPFGPAELLRRVEAVFASIEAYPASLEAPQKTMSA
jgi:two-component system, cell cycle sensor histidine kinase and response regulator CckA